MGKNKKLDKIFKILQNSGVKLSSKPTNVLFVSNSSVLVGVPIESLEELFTKFDPNCSFTVYPRTKSYSFVQFSDVQIAKCAKSELDGTKPETFPSENPPISLLFVDKLPISSNGKINSKLPNGLQLFSEFISKQFESELIEFIERRLPQTSYLKNRRVLHFGYKFNYDENSAFDVADEPIPTIFDGIIDLIMEKTQIPADQRPNQITVNIYAPGQGIPPHIDTHSAFAEPICSLSCCSDVVMEFRDIASTARHCDVLLARRSLMMMTGEARYRFKHSIMSRKYDMNPENNRLIKRQKRISITFRRVSEQPCQCQFIEFCDWDRAGKMRVPSSNEEGEYLEREYVGKVYERIADHFDLTRHSNWSGVAAFLNSLAPNSLLVDVGCGNGKYLLRSDSLIKFGCDLSENLLKIAGQKGCNVFRADALELPFRNASFDAAICIAVIHHFSTEERRCKAIQQILTILRPGGLACVTAWAFEQKTPDGGDESIYAAKMRANKSITASVDQDDDQQHHKNDRLRVHDGRHFTQQDMLVPWASPTTDSGTNSAVVHDFRYYHLFVRGELAKLVENKFGDRAELIKEEYDEGNWVVVFRRK